jgi:hypothetical protein
LMKILDARRKLGEMMVSDPVARGSRGVTRGPR